MQDLHWRYNFNTSQFDFVENNPNQHYEPLLKHVHVPTLVIDINLVRAAELQKYVTDVVDSADAAQIKFQQIIFDGTQDPVEEYKLKTSILNSFAKTKGIRCYLAMSQFNLNTHTHLIEINYPSWLFVFKRQPVPDFNVEYRQYDYSCLNRNPTFHRLVFYTMLKNEGLLDKFVYSFYDRCPYQGHKIGVQTYRGLDQLFSSQLSNQCLESLGDFPIAWHNETQGLNDHTINHDAYQNTWCNIVTETSALVSFTSEKIWKPIAAGQLFLIVGAPGTASWLRKLGFYTFDDDYDYKFNVASRIEMVVQRIKERSTDVPGWWKQNKFQIEHNYYLFKSGNVEKSILDPLVAQLNQV